MMGDSKRPQSYAAIMQGSEHERTAARIEALEAENERLREALAFYGRPYSWRSSGMTMQGPQPSAAELDGGERARQALKEQSNG